MRRRWLLALAGVVLPAGPVLAGDGVLALQSAAPSCRNETSAVYVDCGNGTVTDNRTGLVWLANADCFGKMNWHRATATVAALADESGGICEPHCDCGLSDGSSPGEWRLPTIGEWRTMIGDALGQTGDPDCRVSPPTITNDSGQGCWVSGPSSFSGVVSWYYWSSTPYPENAEFAWIVGLGDADFGVTHQYDALLHVWPVRGGQ